MDKVSPRLFFGGGRRLFWAGGVWRSNERAAPTGIGGLTDNRRQNGLIGAGLRLLRFTPADVYGNPDLVALQVRHALNSHHSGTDGPISSHGYSQSGSNGWSQEARSSRTRRMTSVP